jgi:two-component system sensor histidine kinase GlrK
MADQAQVITLRSNELINREVEAMRATAAQAQRITLWQLLALVPVVVFLVIGFAILIARPIRQLDAAIRRLGGGEFNMPVEVSGPDDLQFLGERLEWMRLRLVDLEQQKNRLLRQVSHELKTPLTALREGAELLSDEVVGKLSPEQREIAEILRHNSIELQKLIEDLLSYGASQFHKVALELKPLSIRQIVNRVVDDQKLAIRAKDLRLEIGVDEVTVAADFEKLRVVIDNLMSNAIKFSSRGGTVAISARRAEGWLELDVADSGPGIATEDIAHIFDPFYQGRNNAVGLVQGTGIGLSVVKEYIAAHGGSVEVADHGGSGALLRVRLPLDQSQVGA